MTLLICSMRPSRLSSCGHDRISPIDGAALAGLTTPGRVDEQSDGKAGQRDLARLGRPAARVALIAGDASIWQRQKDVLRRSIFKPRSLSVASGETTHTH